MPRVITDRVTHGTAATYGKYGCRCDPCSEAGRAKARAYYRANREARLAYYQANRETLLEYQAARRIPKPKISAFCEQCGDQYQQTGRYQRFCTERCQWKAKRLARPLGLCEYCKQPFRYSNGTTKQRFCSQACAVLSRPRKPKPGPRCRIHIKDCAQCGKAFVARRGHQKICSDECRRERNIARLTDLYITATNTGTVRQATYWRHQLIAHLRQRDGDNCGICHQPMLYVPTGPRGTDDRGATIDHIHPRSKGGSDDLTNLRLAHWSCNRQRGNRDTPLAVTHHKKTTPTPTPPPLTRANTRESPGQRA